MLQALSAVHARPPRDATEMSQIHASVPARHTTLTPLAVPGRCAVSSRRLLTRSPRKLRRALPSTPSKRCVSVGPPRPTPKQPAERPLRTFPGSVLQHRQPPLSRAEAHHLLPRCGPAQPSVRALAPLRTAATRNATERRAAGGRGGADVMSLVDNASLAEHPKAAEIFKPDVLARAAELRKNIPSGTGAYSHSQGVRFIRATASPRTPMTSTSPLGRRRRSCASCRC